MGAQPMVISHVGSRFPQQIGVGVHGLQNAGKEEQKLPVFVGPASRIQQVLTLIRGQRPVVVFAGAIDAGEGLFMEQTDQSLLVRHSFQGLHHDLVVVGGYIGFCIDGSQFVLCRRYFIVLGLGRNAHLP